MQQHGHVQVCSPIAVAGGLQQMSQNLRATLCCRKLARFRQTRYPILSTDEQWLMTLSESRRPEEQSLDTPHIYSHVEFEIFVNLALCDRRDP
jgi:hypothetical protein